MLVVSGLSSRVIPVITTHLFPNYSIALYNLLMRKVRASVALPVSSTAYRKCHTCSHFSYEAIYGVSLNEQTKSNVYYGTYHNTIFVCSSRLTVQIALCVN